MASLSSFADEVNLLWSDIKGSCVKNCATLCLLKKRVAQFFKIGRAHV